jgi:hypothetical protein
MQDYSYSREEDLELRVRVRSMEAKLVRLMEDESAGACAACQTLWRMCLASPITAHLSNPHPSPSSPLASKL